MRIISGILRGKKLISFRGDAIRPTSDRIKGSIFNILAKSVQDARVLDLYAGSGNLSLEALSRGARSAVLIDDDKRSLDVIERNIKVCRLQSQTRTIRWDIRTNLNCIDHFTPPFDLVFMDPPYNTDLIPITFFHLQQTNSLAEDAVLVVEHHSPLHLPADVKKFQIMDHRKYGKTLVSFFRYML